MYSGIGILRSWRRVFTNVRSPASLPPNGRSRISAGQRGACLTVGAVTSVPGQSGRILEGVHARLQRVLVAAFVCVGAILPALPAAGRGDELAAAKQRVAEARAAANAVAGKVTEAYGQLQALGDEIIVVEARIADGQARAEDLRVAVRRRAVNAYTDNSDDTIMLIETEEPSETARRTEYLDRINAKDNAAVAELHALNEDLEVQHTSLDEAKKNQQSTLDQLKADQAKLDGLLAEAEAAQAALEERLARESAARRAAEVAAEAARRTSQRLPAERARRKGREVARSSVAWCARSPDRRSATRGATRAPAVARTRAPT